jgi:hypothetical protein
MYNNCGVRTLGSRTLQYHVPVTRRTAASPPADMPDRLTHQTKRLADTRLYAEWMRTNPLPEDAHLSALSNEISLRSAGR